jgi:5-methyltetrahydropteroyltriglutamate--homocysteine methyltransferase
MSLQRRLPPFRADHVGSLLRPPDLLAARERFRQGMLSRESLTELENQAIRDVVKMQEDIGLQSATDGEFRRNLWHMDFLKQFTNVSATRSSVKVKFHTEEGDIEREPSALRVDGRLSRPRPIFIDHFKFLKSATTLMPKITIPSPSVLHFRGGRGALDEHAYPDISEFYLDLARCYSEEISDLAAAGCRYLQLD